MTHSDFPNLDRSISSHMKSLLFLLLLVVALSQPIPKNRGYRFGLAAAPIDLEIHFALTCPDCKQAFADIFSPLLKEYVNRGLVQLHLNLFPLPFHTASFDLAKTGIVMANECRTVPACYLNFPDCCI
ncbi:hypothetical protein GEMRC1_010337 [Eukaryota sp. GEM-RC1]